MNKFNFLCFMLSFLLINASNSEYLHFLELGDWGSENEIQKAVAASMNRYATANPIDFVVTLGDNFYPFGVRKVSSQRFQTSFRDVYITPYKSLNVNWYVIAGNHDHIGSVDAQIEYSKEFPLWNFPDTFYVKTFQISSKTTLSLVMIDTTQLCNLYNLYWFYDTIESNVYDKLVELLSSIKSTYILVHGHHPIYSKSKGQSTCLNEHLKPLLIKYDVTAYIAGHTHNLQHMYDNQNGLHYFISGAGGKSDRSLSNKIGKNIELKSYWDGHQGSGIGGFLAFNVTDKNIQYNFITSSNAIIHSGTLKARTKKSIYYSLFKTNSTNSAYSSFNLFIFLSMFCYVLILSFSFY